MINLPDYDQDLDSRMKVVGIQAQVWLEHLFWVATSAFETLSLDPHFCLRFTRFLGMGAHSLSCDVTKPGDFHL